MKQVMCALYDSKAEVFGNPFFADNVNLARRIFGDAVMKSGTVLSDHPEDFFLYQVAVWDPQKGIVEPCKPVSVAAAVDFVKKGE